MRMWNVPTKLLCKNHLLGEHLESHMFCGSKSSLEGYVRNGLVELHNIKKRHDELVEEMLRRGWNHKSPIDENPFDVEIGFVDIEANLKELSKRCRACRERIANAYDV